jgi:hypothetical protein
MIKPALHAALAVLLIAGISQVTIAAPQKQKTWIIDEDENIVLVSPHAVHVHHKKNDFEIVCFCSALSPTKSQYDLQQHLAKT